MIIRRTHLEANWIRPIEDIGDICPIYSRSFSLHGQPLDAQLRITAQGIYHGELNGKPVSDAVLMPGWTAYHSRLQVQTYDVTELLKKENRLTVTVSRGWYTGRLAGWLQMPEEELLRRQQTPPSLLAELRITYKDGQQETISTDESWQVFTGFIRSSSIYDGEVADATAPEIVLGNAKVFDGPSHTLIEQQGELIKEQERIVPKRIFQTPKGEIVVDFGQEITGYVELKLHAQAGDRIELSHAEILDENGNFYTENYRSAKAKLLYICRDGCQCYHPLLTFYGFRYIRLDAFPVEPKPEHFTAIAVHSDLKPTGYIRSSDMMLNQLFDNIRWGQKGNFLDIPTDCPQRDERLGWTGDAQVFIRTACYLYDVKKFFTKWLADMAAEQRPNGAIPHVIPDVPKVGEGSAAWADAATICPWQIYEFYGDTQILRNQFDCMKRHLKYISDTSSEKYLWTGCEHFGDWLGIDAPYGSYKGASREDLIASAFYARSTEIVIKAGKVLGEDMTSYEELYEKIVQTFRQHYPYYETQTELVLAIHFGLAADIPTAVAQLVQMIIDAGIKLETGFVGTPYLLHALSDHGHTDLAYQLALRREYPSWLYPVTKGATTMWEHWDGIKPDDTLWSADMNSFNHYAYGAVLDWFFDTAAGIQTVEEMPGFAHVKIAPHPTDRLDWLDARLETNYGPICVCWQKRDGKFRYEISVPVPAQLCLNGSQRELLPGKYIFYSEGGFNA